jgi:hypothetical protein
VPVVSTQPLAVPFAVSLDIAPTVLAPRNQLALCSEISLSLTSSCL